MAEIAVAVASEVAKCLVAPVGRHCGYVIFCDRRVRELNAEIEKLVGTKDDVQISIDEARRDTKPIKPGVVEWLRDAEAGATNARNMLENDGGAKKTCFYGWLPNPKARYRLGNEASKMIKKIKDLIELGQFRRVHDRISPPGRVDSTPNVNPSAGDGGNTLSKSQASTFQDVMEALYDEKHKVIGVYGPGGVGKTTLLEEVEKKIRKEGGPFRMIVKSEVSRTSDLKKIQDNFAYAFGLNLKDEPSEVGRRDRLFKTFQTNEKVLIILDDLWGQLKLEEVGIPSGNESMNCKLLLTSRDKRVLQQRMHADPTFPLKSLEGEEALKLFEEIVGDRLRHDEELKEKAAQVVTKLAGLPLLINSVASTLKCSDVSKWEDMLIKIDDQNNERIVKWSYDHLESQDAKRLFLLCGVIGGTIRVELLLGLCMGLGLFRGFDNKMQSSRNRLNTMLNSLHSFCLLQDGGDGKERVTIHDLYREVVISDVFSDQNLLMIDNNYDSWPNEKLERCWACLVNMGIKRLVELMLGQFAHVNILMLSEQYDMGDCSRMDFTYLRELRVLCLGSMHITSLPSSMEILRNLRSLSISCHVEDVANLGKLKALQILSFVGSEISKLPKELGKLTNLKSLNLSNCYSLKIIEPGALKGLINLEELHMKESFDQWRGKHELAELKSLTKLASLAISISDPKILLKDGDLPFEKLEKFWINVGDVEGREYEGLTTMKLNLEGCDGILSIEWVKKNLQKTQCLYLSNCSEFAGSPRELCTQRFREVKYLDIEDSPSIKYVADSSNCSSLTDFGKLESLFLKNLINLEKICHGPIALGCFNKLKAVRVGQCHQLKYLWCLSDVQKLVQLEEIEVLNCDSMQSIVTHDAREDIVCADNRAELRNVRRPELSKLPNMTSFCTKAEITSEDTPNQVSLPCLKSSEMATSAELRELEVIEDVEILSRLTMTLRELPNLQCLCKQDVKLQGMSILQNLRNLHIHKIGLSFLFLVSMAKCLRGIRNITVSGCPNMKAVIVDEGRNEGTDDIIEFPLLKYLSIYECPVEKFFSYHFGKKELVTTTSDSQDANSDSFFDQKVTFPNITVLKINGLQCKELWNDQIPTNSFQKLKSLNLENCDNLRRIAPPKMWEVLQHCLKNLEVISCRLIKIIYEGHGIDTEGGELRELLLRDLKNMEHIWQSEDLPNVPFPNLIDVEAVRCPRLKVLFTTFTAKFLWQIKELLVESCEDMKLIAGHEKGEERTGTTVTFSNLTVLRLFKLPNFSGFLPGNYPLKFIDSGDYFPSLKICSIRSCGDTGEDRFRGVWERHEYERLVRRLYMLNARVK